MVQDGGIGNSLIWVPTDEPPHMGGGRREPFLVSLSILRRRLSPGHKLMEKGIPSGTSDV